MNESTRRWLRLLWVVAIVGDIVASLLPSDSLAIRTLEKLALSDKAEHMAMYAILALLPAVLERRRAAAAAALGAVALGIALEYVQRFSGWRDFEYGDMVASAAGVGFGFAAGIVLRAVLRLPCKDEPKCQFTRESCADTRGFKLQ